MVLNEGSEHGVYDSTPTPPGTSLASTERDKAAAGLLLFIVLLAKVRRALRRVRPEPAARGSSLCVYIPLHYWLMGCLK